MLSKYYLNDYFPLIDSPLLKEREYMKTDIREEVNKYIMEIDLPGLKKEDILINYENGYLTIKAVKKVELKTEVYVRRERFYGEVKRSFYIGEKKESDIKGLPFRAAISRKGACNQKSNNGTGDDNDHSYGERLIRRECHHASIDG